MNGPAEEAGKVATGVVAGLKEQPLALALICINVMFLMFFLYITREVSATRRIEREQHTVEFKELQKTCEFVREKLSQSLQYRLQSDETKPAELEK